MLRVGACLFLEICFERVGGQGADGPAFQIGGELASDVFGGFQAVGGQEQACARAGEPWGAVGLQLAVGGGNGGVVLQDDILHVVAQGLQGGVAGVGRAGAVAWEVGVLKDLGGGDVDVRADEDVVLLGNGDGLQLFADAACEGGLSVDEEGDVCAEGGGDGYQLFLVEVELPEPVEDDEDGGGVGAAAAKPAAHGDGFVQPDVCAEWGGLGFACFQAALDGLTQGLGGADGKVLGGGDVGGGGVEDALVVAAGGDGEGVGEVDEGEEAFYVVVAVRALADDAEV